ncbi:MAG TPA: putative toxin-antitoxin system toxin component, PIN family [Anaerolineae bacterium]|nr:putative toxin-antitoxin system toxin component, PIN family [Anaerolineae bacterium]HNU04767.1 putative toxin-antitoxin system toxin component, PIN family [Anaerolineae bacterium]
MRAVVDTNILVRAVIRPQGSVGPILQRLRRRDYTLLLSRETLDEVVEVLHRPRLRVKYGLSDNVLRATLRLIVIRSEMIHPGIQIVVCRDPKDDKFLEVAVAGQADVIVSGDDDLLVLNPYAGIPIVPPRQFLTMFGYGG